MSVSSSILHWLKVPDILCHNLKIFANLTISEAGKSLVLSTRKIGMDQWLTMEAYAVPCRVNGLDSSTSPLISAEYDTHSGQTHTRYNGCQAIATAATDKIQMGFSIVNSGASAHTLAIINAATTAVSTALSASGQAPWTPVANAAGTLLNTIFGNCDGLVAADGLTFTPANYPTFALEQAGFYHRSYNSTHCGESSLYTAYFLAFAK